MNLEQGRIDRASSWEVPLSEPIHHWAVPIAVMEGDEKRRVGTAFHFSRLGHLFTARHCVDEALDHSDRGRELAGRDHSVRIAQPLVVVRTKDIERNSLDGFPVQTVTSPEPCDIACLTTMFQTVIPQLTLPISFALPAAGTQVRAFGYPSGVHDKLFPDTLHAVEGEVLAHFPPRFAAGYMRGPAFLVSGSVPPGMSGGPVLDERGSVCGVVSAGAETFVGRPAFLVSPLYPALLIEVALHAQPAANFRVNGSRTFMDLCAEGFISTDGTEDQVHFTPDDGGTRIGPVMPVGSRPFVFDSLGDFLENRPSTPIDAPTFRIRIRQTDGASE